MKKLLFFSTFFLFAFQLFAQSAPIHKETTKIIITNELSADENYKLAGQSIIANDFEIKNGDKDFGSIVSEEMEGMRLGVKYWYYFKVSASKGKIVLSAKWTGDMNAFSTNVFKKEEKSQLFDVIYHKKPKNALRVVFDKMEQIASSIDGTKTYK